MILRIAIFVIALAAAGGAAVLSMNLSDRQELAEALPEREIPTRDVLVAAVPITSGEVLSPTNLRWQPLPENNLNDQYILRDEKPEAIVELSGSFVNRSFGGNEPIREERLMETNINLLSNKIASGNRGVAVKISAENTAGGLILPGDRVDVIHTTTHAPAAPGEQTRNESHIIIPNVRVLAIDQTAVQSPEGTAVGKTATLELSPDDAERIMASEASGLLSLALRAVADHAEVSYDVLVAAGDLAEGDAVSSENVRWQPMPESDVTDAFILRTEHPDAIEDFSGAFLNRDVAEGEPIREGRLHQINLNLMSHRLTPGKRAAAVKISAENTAGGFILPGDRVDVIHTDTRAETQGEAPRNESRIIIANVQVLAIDQTSVQTPEGSAVGKTATLELSPEEAERIMAAEASGLLSLALRSVADHADTAQLATPEEIRTVRVHRGQTTSTVTLR